MITPHLEAVALAGSLLLDDGTPPQASDLRLRELMQAYAQGYHGMLLSAPEMHWLYFSGVVFGLFFLGVAIWSHRGEKTLRTKKPQRFRSYTKRRPKRRKRKKK